jgi:limonene-1,2-epoxide hydrolase
MSANSDRVLEFIQAWNKKDFEGLLSFFAPGARYHNIPMEPVEGVEAIRKSLEGFIGMASEIDWVVHHIGESAEGVVMTERTDRFKIGDKWLELPVMGVFELSEGSITGWRDYFDLGQFQSQLPQ